MIDLILPSFLARMFGFKRLPPKIAAFTSSLNEPASIRFTQSTRADSKLLPVAPVKRSRICCGMRPSEPPDDDEPAGNERKALFISVFETCTGWKWLLHASWVAQCPPVRRRARMFGFKHLQSFMYIRCWCVFRADTPNSCLEITGLNLAGNCRS